MANQQVMLKLIAKDLHNVLDLEDCAVSIYTGTVVNSDFGEGVSVFCNYSFVYRR